MFVWEHICIYSLKQSALRLGPCWGGQCPSWPTAICFLVANRSFATLQSITMLGFCSWLLSICGLRNWKTWLRNWKTWPHWRLKMWAGQPFACWLTSPLPWLAGTWFCSSWCGQYINEETQALIQAWLCMLIWACTPAFSKPLNDFGPKQQCLDFLWSGGLRSPVRLAFNGPVLGLTSLWGSRSEVSMIKWLWSHAAEPSCYGIAAAMLPCASHLLGIWHMAVFRAALNQKAN